MYYTRMHSYMYYYVGNPVCICPMKKKKEKLRTIRKHRNWMPNFPLNLAAIARRQCYITDQHWEFSLNIANLGPFRPGKTSTNAFNVNFCCFSILRHPFYWQSIKSSGSDIVTCDVTELVRKFHRYKVAIFRVILRRFLACQGFPSGKVTQWSFRECYLQIYPDVFVSRLFWS